MKQYYSILRVANRLRLLSLLMVIYHYTGLDAQERQIMTLQEGWKFSLGQHNGAAEFDFDASSWKTVQVPHDWAIAGPFIPDADGNTAKLPWKGEGWYRYNLDLPSTMMGKQIYLVFDGVMAFPQVYVNGKLAGTWDYGYNSFYIDITAFLIPNSPNVIAVHVDTRNHDSRWYPGAGIFRKVQVIAMDPVHAGMWGIQVTTPLIKPNYAKVNVITTVDNQSAVKEDSVIVQQFILSPKGKEVATSSAIANLLPGASRTVECTMTLTDPQRWDIGHGVMYRLKTVVRAHDRILDIVYTDFGVRSMHFTADHGFYLNDKRVQLKGVNLHHDHGPLGAAFYPRAMERQLQLLQEMGCNAIRTSHNAPAPELLDMCDRMGILVLDELFDKYDRKADIMDTTDFEAFARRNVDHFIRRDRNHPSVFLWSVGNEIGDVQWNVNGGFAKLRTMVNEVRRYDMSRPVTLVCDSRNSAALRHFDFYDVHSWNYGRRYDLAHQLEPNKAVIISESASAVSTRGFYEWPLPEKKTDFTSSLQVSSYDLNAPDWAEIPDDDFMWQQEENYVAGEFVWTGFDYLGEPTPYDNAAVKRMGLTDQQASVSSYFGIFDLVGIPKDRYYLYKSYWNPTDTTIHILPHWNWKGMEGKNIPVFVYTNGDCAELFLNGRSLGMRCKKPDATNSVERFRLMWKDVTYETGELKAVSYKEGQRLGETTMMTVGKAYSLKLTPDHAVIHADGTDLSYVLVEAIDKKGNPTPVDDQLVEFTISGSGTIAGVGNGNPQCKDGFQSSQVRLFYGKAMLILRASTNPGNIEVNAQAKGLAKAFTIIHTE